MSKFLIQRGDKTIVNIKVIPNSSKTAIVGMIDDRLKLSVNAAPEKGKANLELIKFFSKLLKIQKSKIEIITGQTSHKKSILIESPIDCLEKIFELNKRP